ncbi:hypothetical protein J6P92_03015 [bacterium]|nr:hypothetical protein [bacterium]
MDKKILKSEKISTIADIELMTKRLNFLIKNSSYNNDNEKIILSDLLNEYAKNIETDTKNYTYLL